MAEYIEREALIKDIEGRRLVFKDTITVAEALLAQGRVIRNAIQEAPTADVVEVVRCKDCKHATFYSCKNDACYKAIICEYKIGIGDENFYCACAEPRTPKERGGEK